MPKYAYLFGRSCILSVLICIFWLSFSNNICANTDLEYGNQSEQPSFDMRTDGTDTNGIRMFASLLLVLALISIGVFFLKKITPYRGLPAGAKHPIQILSRVSLGQRRSICLIRIADEILVIGLTNANVSLLSKMNANKYFSDQDMGIYENPAEHKDSFRRILEKIGIGGHGTSMTNEEEL